MPEDSGADATDTGTTDTETGDDETSADETSSPDENDCFVQEEETADAAATDTETADDSETEAGSDDTGSDTAEAGTNVPGQADDNAETAETVADADQETVTVESGEAEEATVATSSKRGPYDAVANLTFNFPTGAEAVANTLREAADDRFNITIDPKQFVAEGFDGTDLTYPATDWQVSFVAANAEEANEVLKLASDNLNSKPYFQSLSGVGGAIAGESQQQAIAAILFSLLGIVAYVWIRFQKISFGLAAVVALVHDVLVVLGAIAISSWLKIIPGIDEFKISLPVIAAFMTIIGYSLNDTIVVFDRIRETRGKNPDLTRDMINRSIGQTLSRTLLTSVTTFLVVFILFAIGGDTIHGFAFALVIGVIVGTYSSIFIASPVLYWLMGHQAVEPKPSIAKPGK